MPHCNLCDNLDLEDLNDNKQNEQQQELCFTWVKWQTWDPQAGMSRFLMRSETLWSEETQFGKMGAARAIEIARAQFAQASKWSNYLKRG